jgi:hypothetical protein
MPVSALPSTVVTPIPKASTRGTVTAPVVTAPASQARAVMPAISGLSSAKSVNTSAMAIVGSNRTLRLQFLTKRYTPSAVAMPTPVPILATIRAELPLSISNKRAESLGRMRPPAALRVLIAGSAYVVAVPRTKAKPMMSHNPALAGRVAPMFCPSGIRPMRTPSRNNMSPSATARRPAVMARLSTTPRRITMSWNRKRKAVIGINDLNCSMNLAAK